MRFSLIFSILSGLFLAAYAESEDSYLSEIKPLLKARCYACHGALKQKGKLRVDTVHQMRRSEILTSGELLARLTSGDLDDRMPPEGEPLEEDEIDLIRAWVSAGAPAPKDEVEEDDPSQHWAFQYISRPKVPEGDFQNPIDAFLAAKQNELGLRAQPKAERGILIRRLYLDLIGLPPTAEQLASEDSLETIADELLDSPQYGERWGRHWMDVWRYSDWYGLGCST